MNEPNIRFKGFEGEWEKIKLGEVGIFCKGCGYSKSDIKATGMPLFLYGRLYTKYFFITDKVDTYAQLKDSSILSDGDEVVMPASGETPEDIARASAILSKGIILGGDLNIIKVDLHRYITPFIALAISNGSTHYELSRFAQGKSVVHLQNSEMKNGSVVVPTLAEQQSIATYFTHLDTLITSSASRLASLKQMKAASLQAMFPQEGKTVPKIRFKGFEGEWEKVKLEEVAALQGGYAFQSASFCKDGVPIVRIANILNSGEIGGTFVFYEEGTVPSQFILSKGDAVIAMSGATTGKTAVVKDNRFYYQNQRVGKFGHSGKIYYPFVATFIQSCCFVSKLQNLLSSSAQPNISTSDVNSIQINVPKVAEQQAIASYFTTLDKQITLQSQRLEKLKQIKAACLDNMFV